MCTKTLHVNVHVRCCGIFILWSMFLNLKKKERKIGSVSTVILFTLLWCKKLITLSQGGPVNFSGLVGQEHGKPVKHTKIQCCIYMRTGSAWLAEISVLRCRDPS